MTFHPLKDPCEMGVLSRFSHVRPFVTLWTIVRQAPLSMGFSRRLRNLSKITQVGGSGVMLERQVPGGWLPGMDSINRLWRNEWTSLKASVLIQWGIWKKLKQKALGILLIRPIPLSPQAAHFLPHFWILHLIIWSTQDHALGENLKEIHT